MPPSALGLEECKDVDHTLALVLVVVALRASRLLGQGRTFLGHHLVGQLLEADDWLLRIVGLFVELQHILHAPHKLRSHLRDAPLFLHPRLNVPLLSVRLTVSSEISTTISSSTSLSATSCMLQRFLPSGGSLQARATRYASCSPVSLRFPPGRGDSLRARSRLPSTKRLRVRSTVLTLVSSASATSSSVRPSSASDRMRARLVFLTRAWPPLSKLSSSSRSSGVKSTTYTFAIEASRSSWTNSRRFVPFRTPVANY